VDESRRHVLHDQQWVRKIFRQFAKNRLQHRRSAGRCTDRHYLNAVGFDAASDGNTGGRFMSGPTPHDLDLGHELDGIDQITSRCILIDCADAAGACDHGQGARLQCPRVDGGSIVAQSAADNHDRRRLHFHDAARRFEAVHFRHVDIHGDDIRMQTLRRRYRILAVDRDSDHIDGGIGAQYFA
jgi:hypothetical protein